MRNVTVTLFLCALALWFTASALALDEEGDDTLRMYLSKSEVVVLGEFATEPIRRNYETGVDFYDADFKIAKLVKGKEQGNRRVGGTIRVKVIRDFYPDDRPPELKKGGKCILFLKSLEHIHESADPWFDIQTPRRRMVSSLVRLAAEEAKVKR